MSRAAEFDKLEQYDQGGEQYVTVQWRDAFGVWRMERRRQWWASLHACLLAQRLKHEPMPFQDAEAVRRELEGYASALRPKAEA